jgi:hypothetical protein
MCYKILPEELVNNHLQYFSKTGLIKDDEFETAANIHDWKNDIWELATELEDSADYDSVIVANIRQISQYAQDYHDNFR